MNIKNNPLTQKMLDWCQSYLYSLEGYKEGSPYSKEDAKPPQEALIRLVSRGDVPDPRTMEGTYDQVCTARGVRRTHSVDETERMWFVSPDGIKEISSISDDILLGEAGGEDKRYYTVPEFFIGFEDNGKEAFIDVELGPLEGVGFTLPIETDPSGHRSFGIPTDAWAS